MRVLLTAVWGLLAYALAAGSTDLVTGAALLAAGLLAIAIRRCLTAVRIGPGRPVQRRTLALRQRARRTRLPRLLDPDAAGRPRPRAPAAHPSAA